MAGPFDNMFGGTPTAAPSPTFKNATPKVTPIAASSAGKFDNMFATSTPPPIAPPPPPTAMQKIGSAVKTGAEDVGGFFGGLAKGLYNQFANPSAQEQTVETALTSAPNTGNPLLNKIVSPVVSTVMAPVKAYLRFIEPMVLPYSQDIGETIGGNQIVQQMNQGKISNEEGGKVLNDIGVMQKSAPQIVGDAMSAVLAVLTPETAGKLLGSSMDVAANAENISSNAGKSFLSRVGSGIVQGVKGAVGIGTGFGAANVLQSGSTDPGTITKIMGQNLAGAMILGGVTGGLGGTISKPMTVDEAMHTVADMQREVKSPTVKTLLLQTLQSLQDRKAVGSVNDSGDLSQEASAANLTAENPRLAPPSDQEMNAVANSTGAGTPTGKFDNMFAKQDTAQVDLTKPGNVTDIIPPKPSMQDTIGAKLANPKGKSVADIIPPKTEVTVGDSAVKYNVVSDNGTNVKVTNTETGNESTVPKSTVQTNEKISEQVNPTETTKTSGIAKSIEAKAIEAKLTNGFPDKAQFEGTTFKEQAQKSSDLINSGIDNARAVVRGEKPLPDGLRGTALIAGMEEYVKNNPDPKIMEELANSPLVSENSKAAQELGLSRMREPDSATAKLQGLKKSLTDAAGGEDKVSKARTSMTTDMKTEMAKVNIPKEELSWSKFLDTIKC